MQVDVEFDRFAFTSITALRNNKSTWNYDNYFTSLDILRERVILKWIRLRKSSV